MCLFVFCLSVSLADRHRHRRYLYLVLLLSVHLVSGISFVWDLIWYLGSLLSGISFVCLFGMSLISPIAILVADRQDGSVVFIVLCNRCLCSQFYVRLFVFCLCLFSRRSPSVFCFCSSRLCVFVSLADRHLSFARSPLVSL